MKILMINDLYERIGGTEVYLLSLFDILEKRGHKIVVIYGIRAKLDNRAKNRSSYFVDFSRPIREIAGAIGAIIKKESPDIIHIHNLGQAQGLGLYGYIGELCGSTPVVQSVHAHALYCPSGQKYFYKGPRICQRKYGLYCLFSMLLNRCLNSKRPWLSFIFYNRPKQFLSNYRIFRKIIVGSEFMKGFLIQHGLRKENIETLPYFTYLPELKIDEDTNTILFASRVYKEKGLDYLIKAMEYVRTPFKLLVIGEGREINNCKNLCRKKGLLDKMIFFNWEFSSGEYYRKATVVAVPSIWPEPFGIVGIRAMSYAKPVVAFNVGSIPEWLQDKQTGFLIAPYNIKEMAKKIEILFRDKALATRLGQQGRQMAETRFSPDRHVNRLLGIYAEVCG